MNSDKFTPRLLGFMFVFVAVAGVLSGLPLPFNVSLIGPPDNISETMIKTSDNPTAMQMRNPMKSSRSSGDAVHLSERSDASMSIIPSSGRHGQGRIDLAP